MAKTATKTSGKRRTSTRSMKTAKAPRPTKSGTSKGGRSASARSAGDDEVAIDRRRTDRRGEKHEQSNASSAPQLERRKKVNRRRQIDPTTCERDYTLDEVEFMNTLDDYKRKSGRMFPTCSEVLEVLRGLGYVKLSPTELGSLPENGAASPSARPMPNDWPAPADLTLSSHVESVEPVDEK